MNDEFSFVTQIRRDPGDVLPRLIYADFLEECGDPRGEFIRVQVALASTPPGDANRGELIHLEQSLLERFGEAWVEPLRELGAIGVNIRCFHLGLVERAKLQTRQFLDSGLDLCRAEPALHCLELGDVQHALRDLAAFPMPAQITALDLSSKQLEAEQIAELVSASWLDQIVRLQLRGNRLKDNGVQALVARDFPRLEQLELDMNGLGPDAASALARWPTLARLKSLSLAVNQLGSLGIQRLAASGKLYQLHKLDIASNRIGDLGLRSILDTFEASPATSFPALRHLILRANQIGPETQRAFEGSKLFRQLESADQRSNSVAR